MCLESLQSLDGHVESEVMFKQHNISSAQALAMSDWLLDVDARVIDAIHLAKERGFVSTGDAVIVVTGWVGNRCSDCFPLLQSSLVFFSVRAMVQQTLYVSFMPIKIPEE